MNQLNHQNFVWVAIPQEQAWVIVLMAAPFVLRKAIGGSAVRDGDTLRGPGVERRSFLTLLGVG